MYYYTDIIRFKKGYMGMRSYYFLETVKSVLGSSNSHYSYEVLLRQKYF